MSNKTDKQNSDLTDLGAFWKKEKNGKNFLSGKVKIAGSEFTAFIFKNNKSKPNQPDYRLVLSNLDEDLKPDSAQKNSTKASSQEVQEIENQDDIPF